MNIILTVGISGSGKSTWVKEFMKKNPDYLCVNKDSIRLGLTRGTLNQFFDRADYPTLVILVNNMVEEILDFAANNGYNIIVDNTNLEEKYINQYINHPRCKTYQFKIFPCSPILAKYRVMDREHKYLFNNGEPIDLAPVSYIDTHYENYLKILPIIQQKYEHLVLK